MDSSRNVNDCSSVVYDRSELTEKPQQPEQLQQSIEPQEAQETQQLKKTDQLQKTQQQKEPNQKQKKQQLQDPQESEQLQEIQQLQNVQELQHPKKPQQLQEQQELTSTGLAEDKNLINRPPQPLMDGFEPVSFNFTKSQSRPATFHQIRKCPGQPYNYAEKEPWSEEIVWPTLDSKLETRHYDKPIDYIRQKLLEPPKPKVKLPPPPYPPWMPIHPMLRREPPPSYEQLSRDMSNSVQIRFEDTIYQELSDDCNTRHIPIDRICLVDEECSASKPVKSEDVEYDELQQFSSDNETGTRTSLDTDYFEGNYEFDCGHGGSDKHDGGNDDCDGNGAERCLDNHECHSEYWV